MGFEEIMSAISTVGFPIACCIVLFYQNNKLTETIAQLKETLIENTTILKGIGKRMDKED